MDEFLQFKIKLPRDVKQWIAVRAAQNFNSQSKEIVLALREKMEREAHHVCAGKDL